MAVIKEIHENFCEVCGEKALPAKVAKTRWTKENKMLTGTVWYCSNDHMSKTRIHKVTKKKLGG